MHRTPGENPKDPVRMGPARENPVRFEPWMRRSQSRKPNSDKATQRGYTEPASKL